jgi:antitoxin component YwqK of YwqJK toxin-antitoxin module
MTSAAGDSGRAPERVRDDQLDYGPDLIYYLAGERFTGIGYEDVPGFGVSEISYKDGFQDGPARDWYPSGTLKSESWYRENARHGFSRDYSEDQVKVLEELYEYGILVRRTSWDESGRETGTWAIDPHGQAFARLLRYREQKRWPEVT